MASLAYILFFWVLSLSSAIPSKNESNRPNIIVIMADDLGWWDTSIYNPLSPTPNIANLSRNGLLLEHHYVFRYCSPTRRSLFSGRFPNHITTVQPDGDNLCSDFLPLNATILSEKLAGADYDCHFLGKGHLGYQTMDHLPINRGFKTHFGFLGGSETYSHGGGSANASDGKHDLWQTLAPAYDAVPKMEYSTDTYAAEAVKIIEEHGKSQLDPAQRTPNPLFMYFAVQNVHAPYQMPPTCETQEYPLMWDNTYANMLHALDSATANVTSALQKAGIWDSTLVLWTADNGGIGRGNNHPLRGHKHDPWEGGTRATAFLTGGFLPAHLRGTKTGAKLLHISDWYPTFCRLAGVDPQDVASFGDLERDIDGVDVWPLLTGTNTTHPRPVTPTSEVAVISVESMQWWKLITLAGNSNYYYPNQTKMPPNQTECLETHQRDPSEPGRTDPIVNGCPVCNATLPCLYDLLADPGEHINVAASNPDVVARLTAAVASFEKPYVLGHLSDDELEPYEEIPNGTWGTFEGPCYKRRE